MTLDSKSKIVDLWKIRPDGTKCEPASESELQDFEEKHSKIPDDYRWFLAECGSGVVGSEWLDGIDDLFSSHQKFREESSLPGGWNTKELFLIGWDGSGSPIGLLPSGAVVVEYPNIPEAEILAESLEAFLVAGLT